MKNTKTLISGLLLSLACSAVLAEWVEVEEFDDGMKVFVDKASARRKGDTAEVLHLVRWPEPQVEDGHPPYRSTVVRHAYRCTEKGEKYLGSVSYAGPTGDGAKVLTDDNAMDRWLTISELSLEDKLWRIACGAKSG